VRYQKLVTALEDAEDVVAVEVAMDEEGSNIPWERLKGAIALLAQDPRPPAARKLRGRLALRVRVVLTASSTPVHDDVLLVVVTLGQRREVYDR
jgi:mRNA interferase RelE/StbE